MSAWSPWNVTGGLQSEILGVLLSLQNTTASLKARQPYSFRIILGDVPGSSGQIASNNIVSTENIVTSVSNTYVDSSNNHLTVNLDTNYFPDAKYIVTLGVESLRPPPYTSITFDNDIGYLIAFDVKTGSFKIFVESIFTNTQNFAITGTIQRYY